MQYKFNSAITNITLNRATFNNVPIDKLSSVNFFFGNNGTGKSSIAQAIKENDGVVWGDGHSDSDYDILIYNQEFINNNFANYENLKGVFIFGEEDIKAKYELSVLTEKRAIKENERQLALNNWEKKKAELDTVTSNFQSKCFSQTVDIRKNFSQCLKGKKTKKNFADAILVERSPIKHNLSELTQLYAVVFDETSRPYAELKKPQPASYLTLSGNELLNKIIVNSSNTNFTQFLKTLGKNAFDWVHNGYTHFSDIAGDKCPYCQQKLPINFESEIEECFEPV